MILKGNQRGGSKQLSVHLLSGENEHIEVLKVEGFCSDNLDDALQETYAISKATQCKKFFFSLVMSPPEEACLSNQDVYKTAERTMQKLGLQNQPYCIVAHEKEGRRHYHLVVSRIDTQRLKAIKLPYYKHRLNDLSREIYLENGWKLPKGFKTGYQPDPRNFTLAEWHQSKRIGAHPKYLKAAIKRCWDISDSRKGFEAALAETGCFLAKGDRRNSFVAVSWQGEIIPLNKKNLGAVLKDIRGKLGEPQDAKSIKEVEAMIAVERYGVHKRLRREMALQHQAQRQPFTQQRRQIVKRQREERQKLVLSQEQRTQHENAKRHSRLNKGFLGLWDFVTGKSRKQKQINKDEAFACQKRDEQEHLELIQAQLAERQTLQQNLNALRDRHHQETQELNAAFVQQSQGMELKGKLKREFESQNLKQPQTGPDFGMEM